jgi:hypothetical protein
MFKYLTCYFFLIILQNGYWLFRKEFVKRYKDVILEEINAQKYTGETAEERKGETSKKLSFVVSKMVRSLFNIVCYFLFIISYFISYFLFVQYNNLSHEEKKLWKHHADQLHKEKLRALEENKPQVILCYLNLRNTVFKLNIDFSNLYRIPYWTMI